MGRHAFADLPPQARHLADTYPEIRNEALAGAAQGWDMPVARWRADQGFDARYTANPHATLSFTLDGVR